MDGSTYNLLSVVAAGITALATLGLAIAAVVAGRVAYRHLNVVLKQMQSAADQLQLATEVARHQRSAITHDAVQRFSKNFNEQHKESSPKVVSTRQSNF